MSKQFYIRLQHGTPSILLQTTTLDPGQRRLAGSPTSQTLLRSSTTAKVGELVTELEGILKNLPTEVPPGSQDIYGMDMGLMYESDNFQWANGGPQGWRGYGTSTVEATDQQREEFGYALGIVEELIKLGRVDT